MQTTTNPSEMLLALMEHLTAIGDAVEGYRADLGRRGFSETAAEVMAVQFHAELIRAAFAGGGR